VTVVATTDLHGARASAGARMVQLDALRAFAVFAVMLLHFWPENFFVEHFPVGATGLYLFFVLSGFLITGILDRGRTSPRSRFIPEFYLRRALRLLPLYYAVVVFLLFFSPDAQQHWPCYAVQIMNVCITAQHQWGPAGHFWSLAAEEQFYLLWPFAVLFLKRRWLIVACWMLILLAPLYRAAAMIVTHEPFAGTLLPGVVDCLAAGALLALEPAAFPARVTLPMGLTGAAIVALMFNSPSTGPVADEALQPTLMLPLLCWLVSGASEGFGGALGRVLSNPALRYIGRISYCMYVVHYPLIRAPAVFRHLLLHLPGGEHIVPFLFVRLQPGPHALLRFGALSAATIAIAAFSWQFYEGPINSMRNRISLAPWFGGGAKQVNALGTSKPPLETALAQREVPSPNLISSNG
jgi:peptidoglycan/LPS O-acetylase OafA/YrhL